MTRGRQWWVELLLGALFFGWMYATPLLLLLGLMNRTSEWPEAQLAEAYARTTRYFVIGLTLAFGAPVIGMAGAAMARRRRWIVRFGYAFAFSILIGMVLGVIGSMAHAPLFGQTVESPPPPYRGCVAYSGGTNTCPGG